MILTVFVPHILIAFEALEYNFVEFFHLKLVQFNSLEVEDLALGTFFNLRFATLLAKDMLAILAFHRFESYFKAYTADKVIFN